jgi:hypothetical protein
VKSYVSGVEQSGDNLVKDPAVDIGQAEVAAGMAIRQLFVIEAAKTEDRSVQVVDMDFGSPHNNV